LQQDKNRLAVRLALTMGFPPPIMMNARTASPHPGRRLPFFIDHGISAADHDECTYCFTTYR
jgi:hypothetical protein